MKLIVIKANRANKNGDIFTEDVCKELVKHNPHLTWNEADKAVETHATLPLEKLNTVMKFKVS